LAYPLPASVQLFAEGYDGTSGKASREKKGDRRSWGNAKGRMKKKEQGNSALLPVEKKIKERKNGAIRHHGHGKKKFQLQIFSGCNVKGELERGGEDPAIFSSSNARKGTPVMSRVLGTPMEGRDGKNFSQQKEKAPGQG